MNRYKQINRQTARYINKQTGVPPSSSFPHNYILFLHSSLSSLPLLFTNFPFPFLFSCSFPFFFSLASAFPPSIPSSLSSFLPKTSLLPFFSFSQSLPCLFLTSLRHPSCSLPYTIVFLFHIIRASSTAAFLPSCFPSSPLSLCHICALFHVHYLTFPFLSSSSSLLILSHTYSAFSFSHPCASPSVFPPLGSTLTLRHITLTYNTCYRWRTLQVASRLTWFTWLLLQVITQVASHFNRI